MEKNEKDIAKKELKPIPKLGTRCELRLVEIKIAKARHAFELLKAEKKRLQQKVSTIRDTAKEKQETYKKHLERNMPVKCKICDTYLSPKSMNRHYKNAHPDAKYDSSEYKY